MLLISRHGKTRLNKYYKPFNQKERQSIQREVSRHGWACFKATLGLVSSPLIFGKDYNGRV
jgi:hypothetical protein